MTETSTAEAFRSALLALQQAFKDLARPAMIIGGLAAVARGIPRFTRDIDATIAGEALDLDRALALLQHHGFEPRIEHAAEFARQRLVLLLRHRPSAVDLDLGLAWLPFEHEALSRATSVDFGGVNLPVVAVDDLIVLKAVAWRLGDRSDIERLLIRHGRTIDLVRIRQALEQLLNMLDEPERLVEFDRLVADALREP